MNINPLLKNIPILIKGAGDLATGVATRLYHAGFPVAMTELLTPLMVRRTVSFGSAVYESEVTVEDITAVRSSLTELNTHLKQGFIPVLIDPMSDILKQWSPVVLIDAIIAKVNTGTKIDSAPLVIALGPGFYASWDCHLVIETNRGHRLGRIIVEGSAEANTGSPSNIKGQRVTRVLRAPVAGYLSPKAKIGDLLKEGELIGTIDSEPIIAPFDGVLRGLIHPKVPVSPGYKIGDLDPRGSVKNCYTISDKSLAIGGGVLQAILSSDIVREKMLAEASNVECGT